MLRRRAVIIGFTLMALLAVPHAGRADIIDVIWGMSGPQMIGASWLRCKFDLTGGPNVCIVVDKPIGDERPFDNYRVWLSIEEYVYTSTGRNGESDEPFDWWKINMFSVAPMVEARSHTWRDVRFFRGNVSLFHSAGFTYDSLFGSGFDSFAKIGFKFKPIGIAFGRWTIAPTIRIYPNGYQSDEFGFGPRLGKVDRPSEDIYGLAVGYKFRW